MSQSKKVAFSKVVDEQLFPDDAFYQNAVDDSAFVDGEKVVYPVAGDPPTAVENPTVFPLVGTGRLDTINEYYLNLFATLPSRISTDEKTLLNYDKMKSITKQHNDVLNRLIAERFLKIWFPVGDATKIRRTTGTAGTTNGPVGSTGNRKKAVANDIIDQATLMNGMDIPQENRFALLDSQMYGELMQDDDFKSFNKTGVVNIMEKGVVAMYAGFKIYVRSRAGIYNAALSVNKEFGAAIASTDQRASLFWHKDFVTKAKGKVETFIDEKNPSYLGDIINFSVRAGGRLRADKLGVTALVQDAA